MAPPLQRNRRLRLVARALGAAGDEEDGVATATSTRAGTRAGLNIQGRGYSAAKVLTDLPEQDPSAVYGAQEKLAYQQFKEARAGKGMGQYTRLEGEYSRYLEDPYSDPPVPREPLSDEVEVLIIGAGFASLLMTARLHAAGFADVRICEKGGDVGGTWYWNRYPGIACDVESYSYFPLLEEMDCKCSRSLCVFFGRSSKQRLHSCGHCERCVPVGRAVQHDGQRDVDRSCGARGGRDSLAVDAARSLHVLRR